MRRGVWVVLGLMGLGPMGALAQEARGQSAEQARAPEQVSNEALQQQITELWQGFRLLQQEVAALREDGAVRQEAPAVGGSGQAGTASAGEAPSDLIIVEMPAGEAGQGASGQAAGQGRSTRAGAGAATGGSGMRTGGQAQANVPDEQVYLGRVRSVTEDRLLMVNPRGQVFEFGLSKQTRVLGPGGASASLQSLKEGTPVRTVAREGEERSQVLILQVLEQPRRPSR